MKKILLYFCFATFLLSCDSGEEKTAATSSNADSTTKSMVDLPYTASYSSSWSTDVSDADLKMVLMSYKDWADGNMNGLGSAMADTVTWDMSSGDHKKLSKADIRKCLPLTGTA